ncbi:hypothetical protein SKAU_G00419750 [Synaphobranchus kaupii]|uniref:Uncharacterized protein n=1 Tax=Synaphobranchus kaupii TaxID=118154 RepID=A0A9Q1E6E2_SYNKA|nr:hypothetical protein SKAU_G00419750 [Synaphobranchus kaupii]
MREDGIEEAKSLTVPPNPTAQLHRGTFHSAGGEQDRRTQTDRRTHRGVNHRATDGHTDTPTHTAACLFLLSNRL